MLAEKNDVRRDLPREVWQGVANVTLTVPMVVEMGVGDNWLAAR